MPLPGITRMTTGIIGNNIVVSTTVCQIATPGAGRYRVWGTVRHTLEDGVKLIVGASLILSRIAQQAANAQDFGPITVDVLLPTDNIILQLAVPTGAADTASATMYAEPLSKPY